MFKIPFGEDDGTDFGVFLSQPCVVILGMPLIRKMERGLWEVRSNISTGIARVFFTVTDGLMILLHGFVKKSQKTPQNELDTARRRLNNLEKD
jgi:phage-related protein